MAEVLPDSTIVIDLLNRVPAAVEFASGEPASSWLLHPIVEVEVLVGARSRLQLRRLETHLNRMPAAEIEVADLHHCRAFVKRYTLAHGIGWPDCLIAATAMRLGVPVVTLNDRHFRVVRGLRVIRPY